MKIRVLSAGMVAVALLQLGSVGASSALVAGGARAATPPIQLTTGETDSCVVLSTGIVRCWGLDTWGQLGDHDTKNKFTPVTAKDIVSPAAFASGWGHMCEVTTA